MAQFNTWNEARDAAAEAIANTIRRNHGLEPMSLADMPDADIARMQEMAPNALCAAEQFIVTQLNK